MAICRFCGQEFVSGQAVKAHLKACPTYRERPKATTLPKGNPSGSPLPIGGGRDASGRDFGAKEAGDFDPVGQLEKQVAVGRLRLTMREIDEAHADLDRKAETKERDRRRQVEREAEGPRRAAQEREAERSRAEEARLEHERQEDARRRRRERIQAIKQIVMAEPGAKRFGLPDVSAQVPRAIEDALSDLPVDELPDEELAANARDARDRVHRKAEAAMDQADAAKREAQMRALQLAERKRRLIEQGMAFAKRKLEAVEDLGALERLRIRLRIERELEELTGNEVWADIEDLIDENFETEGIEFYEIDDDQE